MAIDRVGTQFIQVALESSAYTLGTITDGAGAYSFIGSFAARPHALTIH